MTETTDATMMEALWLDDLIDPVTRGDLEKQVVAAAEKDKGLRSLILATPILRGAILRAVTARLHVDPLALLADGWCTAKDIRAVIRDARKSDKPIVLKLAPHSIERDIRPTITVDIGKSHSFELDVGLGLAGHFEGLELTVIDEKLVSVGSGTCRLSLQTSVAGHTVMSREIKTIALPGEYRFAQPLALR
jgi:hypothetical protein